MFEQETIDNAINAANNLGNASRGGQYEKQRAIVYDLLCAGEIEGVVGGLSGVYFNGTSIVDGGAESKKLLPIQGSCTTVASNTTISNLVDPQGTGIFTNISTSDITENARYLQIKGAGNNGTLAAPRCRRRGAPLAECISGQTSCAYRCCGGACGLASSFVSRRLHCSF